MARQWRVAVIGTGTVGEWHVKTVQKVPGCQLVAMCDLDPAKLQRVLEKNKLSIPVYTDTAELFAKEQIDVVHVCTPSGEHLEPAIFAMKNGKSVIVEKPMEISTDRIDQMNEAATKYGVKLAGIFQNRWNEANKAIRDAVQQGRFGRISWAGSFTPWYRTDKYYEEGGWRGTWKIDGGGAVMNQGVHQVDLMQWIVGPVKSVSAYFGSRIHGKIEVEDTLTCALLYENGAFGSFVSTTAMFPGGSTRLEVGGEFGTAISESGLRKFKFKDARPEDEALLDKLDPSRSKSTGGGANPMDVVLDMHGQNMASIYGAWAEGQEAETCGTEARKAVAIIQAMYESARKNGMSVEVK